MNYPYIWVEDIIAAGKSTLADKLAQALNLRALHEPVDSNPYLGKFYKDPKRWAYPMQIHLLAVRYGMQQLAAYESTCGDTYKGVVLDRGLPGDRVFAKMLTLSGHIDPQEWETYQTFYKIMTCSLIPPSLMVFLNVEPEVAFERCEKRRRPEEEGIKLSYLKDLHKGYLDLMAEVESGLHPWARGMQIMRVAWNADYQPIEPIVQSIKDKFHI